jgi:hypothetical protein
MNRSIGTPAFGRRSLVAATITAGLVVAPLTPLVSAAANASAPPSIAAPAGSFAEPSATDRPFYRFWTSGGHLTAESAKSQVDLMKQGGAGGVEFNQAGFGMPGYTAATEGFGTPAWSDAMQAVFESAADDAMQADFIYTPGWSAGIQGLSPDKPGTDKEITFGRATVAAGDAFNGVVPAATLPSGVTKADLQAVVAYRCSNTCNETVPVLVARTAVDLTPQVSGGNLSWTAPASPAGSTWIVVASWMHGTGKTNGLAGTATPSYVVDHFSDDGFTAIKNFWDTSVFDSELRSAVESSGGSMFFDSLELEEGTNRHWTTDFLDEFEQRRGYSLVPYLAAVGVGDPVFDFAGDTGERVREDYRQTLSDLFRDYHLKPLRTWAHSMGLTLRGQAYASNHESSLDMQEMATLLDVAEGEDRSFNEPTDMSLTQNYSSDIWRALSSASAQSGSGIISTECCATEGGALRIPRQNLLADVNQQLVTGVNKFVWHGWGDTTAGASTTWPGYGLFGGAVPDQYGPHNPTWTDDRSINDYVGRMSNVLRRGELKNDIAIYRQGAGHSKSGATGDLYFTDQSVAEAGYTYGFMNRTLIGEKKAVVKNGRLLSGGLDYQAFVVNNTPNANYETPMDLATAEKVLSWAKDGLPIVVVGTIPDRARGNAPGDDAAQRGVLDELSEQSGVRYVAKESGVLGALRSAGVRPAATYSSPSQFLNIHRQTADSQYWYFWNLDEDAAESTTVDLTGAGDPYRYDPWTGKVARISDFTRTATGVRVKVAAQPGDGVVLALTSGNSDTAALPMPAADVVSTTADTAVVDEHGKVTVSSTRPGTFTTVLSNGRTVTSTIAAVPAVAAPSTWNLEVTSYSAGATVAETAKTPLAPVAVAAGPDGTLPDWQQITGLGNKSGEGTYTATVEVPAGIAQTGGVRLDLGKVLGTYRVSVNGQALPPVDQMDAHRIDLGAALRPGANTIVVHVATLLGNARFSTTAPYGLVGPVTTTAYGTATVDSTPAPPTTPPTPVMVNKAKPSIVGKARVGRILTAKAGRWTPTPTSYSYVWYAGAKKIAHATKPKLKVTKKLVGKRLRVVVTAKRSGYTSAVASSARTAKVVKAKERR